MKQRKYLWIFMLAVFSRWLIFVLGWAASGREVGFFTAVYESFIKAGDTPHYLEIARNGYTAVGESRNLIVFFPLYPLLIRIVSVIVRNDFISGLLISNVCSGLGACFFYRLLRMDFTEEQSCFGLFVCLLFPFSFFTAAVYTEGLFFLLTAAAFYAMRKKNWISAAICGFLCALTRIQGLALLPMFLYELLRERDKKAVAAVIAPALGFFIYLLINRLVYGQWLMYLEFQAAAPWYNRAQWIGANLKQHYEMALEHPALAMYIYWVQLILFFASVGAMFYGLRRRIRTSYIVYAGVYTAMTYFHGWQISGGRYMSMCLPLFIIAAAMENRIFKSLLLMVSVLFYTILAILWMKGYAIM